MSLLDLAGPYYELILNADCLDEAQRKKCEGDYRVKIVDGLSVGKLSSICRGRLVVLLKKDITYSEYFLSDLYRFMREYGEQNIKLNENGYLLKARDLEMSDEEYFRNIGTKTSGKRLRIEESERVIIFGAGGNGLETARYFGMENIMFYCDNDVKKIGQTLGRILIISPDELAKLPRTYPVVVSPYGSRGEDIVLQLKNMGIHKWIRWPDVCRERLTADDLMDM